VYTSYTDPMHGLLTFTAASLLVYDCFCGDDSAISTAHNVIQSQFMSNLHKLPTIKCCCYEWFQKAVSSHVWFLQLLRDNDEKKLMQKKAEH